MNELIRLKECRDNIDRFLARFLKEFERKMDYEDTSTPHWKLYKDKSMERLKLTEKINTLQFNMSKLNNISNN